MIFLYFLFLFCVFFLPTRGYITISVLRSPESTSDQLDLRIGGSIDLGSNWHYSDVRNAISKLGQSLRLDDRAVAKNNREVERNNEDLFHRHPGHKFGGHHDSGLLHQHKEGKSEKQDDSTKRIVIGPMTSSEYKDDKGLFQQNKEGKSEKLFNFMDRIFSRPITPSEYKDNNGLFQQLKEGKSEKRDSFTGRIVIGSMTSSEYKDDNGLFQHQREGKWKKRDNFPNRIVIGPMKSSEYKDNNGLFQQLKEGKSEKRDSFTDRIVIGPMKSSEHKDNNGLFQQLKEGKSEKRDSLTDRIVIGPMKSSEYKDNNGLFQQLKEGKSKKRDSFIDRTVRGQMKSSKDKDDNGLFQHQREGKSEKRDNFPNRIVIGPITSSKDKNDKDFLHQRKEGKSKKRDNLRERITIGPITSSEDKDNKNSIQWDLDMSDYDNVKRQREKPSETRGNRGALRHKRHKDGIVGVTQLERMKTTDHKVKEDERTKEFSVHMFKQTMQVFDSIKRKMDNSEMQAKVDEMARSYKDQFADFVRQQRGASVRTKMGDERAILHTMDTSNSILQRLVNFLKADMEKGNTRTRETTLQREVDAARDLEYKHVCSKYGYCRSDKGFTTMLQNCIKVLINVDDEKMYRARDAITEVLKTADYSKIIDSKTDKSFKQKITRLEKKEPETLREALRVLLGMLSNPETPLEVEGGNSEVVKRTAAFYTLLAMWEDAMPGDESNKLEWADIERSLRDWSDGKRSDIQEIIQALERNMNRGLKKIDPDTAVKMKEQIKIIRG